MQKQDLEYIEEQIRFLNIQDTDGLEHQFFYQEKYLNSMDYNYTLLNIEHNLNILYEKARTLQDAIDFSRLFIKENIYKTTDECNRILSDIEDNIDSLRQNNYMSTAVSFVGGEYDVKDRGGTSIPVAAISNRCLTLSSTEEASAKIKDIKRTSGFKPYKENLDEIKKGEAYRSFYILDGPVNNGLVETIDIALENEGVYNYVNVETSNCRLLSIEHSGADNTATIVDKLKGAIKRDHKINKMTISTVTQNYKKIVYYVDQERASDNFWDKISENEYNRVLGKGKQLTQAEIDDIAGLTKFKEEYDKYVKDIELWIQKRNNIADINKANGYSDSVPKVDFIVAPEQISGKKDQGISKDISGSLPKYKDGEIIQNEMIKKEPHQTFPDAEKYKYQVYDESKVNTVDKMGMRTKTFVKLISEANFIKPYQF